jgi:hypothetical protein
MTDIDSIVDSEYEHNDTLRDLYPDEDEIIAKRDYLESKGYVFNTPMEQVNE